MTEIFYFCEVVLQSFDIQKYYFKTRSFPVFAEQIIPFINKIYNENCIVSYSMRKHTMSTLRIFYSF